MGQAYAPDDPFAVKITGRVNELAKLVRDQGVGVAAGRERLDKLIAEVEGVGIRLGEATGTLKGLLEAQGEDEEEDGKRKTQRDWLLADDPKAALLWVDSLRLWVDTTFAFETDRTLPACWLWHPRVVRELLALQAHRSSVYGGSSPIPVSDYLGRYLDPAVKRVLGPEGLFARCLKDGHHSYAGEEVEPDWGAVHDYVHWWTRDRTGRPPGLTKV